ncbi:MAG: UDP-N-acetylmuramate--L-alanine ligase [Clostridia bacterium]|nr:UDP-N-acetylmuramate--L-alanine ligase [Clostridia bacterium]
MENYEHLLDNIKRIHFVGIGGSGMCPLAEILHHEGYEITGSDTAESDTLERIRSYGIPVTMGHFAETVIGADLVVYTAAVKSDNPELVSAKEHHIPAVERCIMLGAVVDKYKDSVAVCGTHGKTTTTSMITQIFTMADFDPTAVIGAKLPFIGGNSRVGKSDIIVCEACEYVDSFLHIYPAVTVILNVDEDHLDYFGTLDRIKESFTKFAGQTSDILVVNGDDENTMFCIDGMAEKGKRIVTFGFGEGNDFRAEITGESSVCDSFDIIRSGQRIASVKLAVPGTFNVMNALAAAAATITMGVSPEAAAEALGAFRGAHRRFEILGNPGGITVADDFAHHPTELRATLTTAMSMGYQNVWAVFQPHTFSRTYTFLSEFAEVLSIPDHCILSEILPVRETNIYNIYSKDLAEKIDGCVWFETFDEIADYVTQKAQPGDLIITIGGGNVYMCAHKILDRLNP